MTFYWVSVQEKTRPGCTTHIPLCAVESETSLAPLTTANCVSDTDQLCLRQAFVGQRHVILKPGTGFGGGQAQQYSALKTKVGSDLHMHLKESTSLRVSS